ELYEKGGRAELAAQEREEIAIIASYLPQQMSEAEARAAIDAAVAETGAAGMKDMGKVMAALKARHAGKMDFAKASALVKARLAGGGLCRRSGRTRGSGGGRHPEVRGARAPNRAHARWGPRTRRASKDGRPPHHDSARAGTHDHDSSRF